MVTIITGLHLDNPSVLSGPMQVSPGLEKSRLEMPQTSCPFPHLPSAIIPQAALQAAAHASVDVKNVVDFYRQWKEIG